MDSGIKGEQAGTTLRAALLRLSDPTKDASDTLENLGIKVTDAQGNMRPFSQIIGEVGEATKGMGSAQKAAALSAIFGTEAVSGMMAVIEAGPDKLNELTKGLQSSDGAAKTTANTMKDNLKGALEELGGAFETAQISIGTALTPALKVLAGALQGVLNWFNNLSPGMQSFLAIGAAVSALIMVLVGVVGFLVAAIGALVMVEWAAVAPILAIIGSVLAVIAILTAFGVAITLAYQKVDWFRNAINTAWEFIKSVTQAAWDYIYNTIIQPILNAIVSFAQEILGKFKEFWAENGEAIKNNVQAWLSAVWSNIQMVMGIIKGIFQAVWPVISGIVKIAWNVIKTTIKNVLDIVLGLISAGMKILQGDWSGAWKSIEKIGKDIWNNIESFFENIDLFQIGKDIINGLIKGIGSMASAVMDKVRSIGSSIKKGLTGILDIHSPSRVMRDEVGKMIPAGIAVGIEAETGTVEKMVNKLSRVINPELEPVGFNAHAGNIGNRNKEVDPILNFADAFRGMNIHVREEADIQKVARELYKLTKGTARMNGVVM